MSGGRASSSSTSGRRAWTVPAVATATTQASEDNPTSSGKGRHRGRAAACRDGLAITSIPTVMLPPWCPPRRCRRAARRRAVLARSSRPASPTWTRREEAQAARRPPPTAAYEIGLDESDHAHSQGVVHVREADEVAGGRVPGGVDIPTTDVPNRTAELPLGPADLRRPPERRAEPPGPPGARRACGLQRRRRTGGWSERGSACSRAEGAQAEMVNSCGTPERA